MEFTTIDAETIETKTTGAGSKEEGEKEWWRWAETKTSADDISFVSGWGSTVAPQQVWNPLPQKGDLGFSTFTEKQSPASLSLTALQHCEELQQVFQGFRVRFNNGKT